jgi:prevent-host-death family protein
MPSIVNVFEAKSTLSRLIEAVENGSVSEIVIARNGRPAARLVPIERKATGQRIGVAKGKFLAPEPSAEEDAEIARQFEGKLPPGKRRR